MHGLAVRKLSGTRTGGMLIPVYSGQQDGIKGKWSKCIEKDNILDIFPRKLLQLQAGALAHGRGEPYQQPTAQQIRAISLRMPTTEA